MRQLAIVMAAATAILAAVALGGANNGSCVPIEPQGTLCEAIDLDAYGPCAMFMGYGFDGEACVGVSGCGCEGGPCAGIYESQAACEEACGITPEPMCEQVDPWSFGDCEMVLGVGFDGRDCVTISGCGCDEGCNYLFDDMESCREACGLPSSGLPTGAVCQADSECAEGLLCCYPCGIQGCENVCTEPCPADEPWCGGGCPMYP